MNAMKSLMILVAGPYRSGTGDDPAKLAENVRAMEAYALPLFRAGHIPVIGEWFALPLVALAGSRRVGDTAFEEIFHPIAERLLEREGTRLGRVRELGGGARVQPLASSCESPRRAVSLRRPRDPSCFASPRS
jgi:hypothetical protein